VRRGTPEGVPLFFLEKTLIVMTPLDAATEWVRRRFSPIPVPHRSKRPVLTGWQELEITEESASQYFNGAAQNIGILLGDRYGSTDVDCDCSQAIAAAGELLPETGLIFGRQSKPLSHYLYRTIHQFGPNSFMTRWIMPRL
jgi:hypothetical protein